MYALLVFCLSLVASASAGLIRRDDSIPNNLSITDFSGSSNFGSEFFYSLKINLSNQTITCTASNNVMSNNCSEAAQPAPFPSTVCGTDNSTEYTYSWSLDSAISPTQPPRNGFSLRISAAKTGAGCSFYGCTFLTAATECLSDNDGSPLDNDNIWEVPSSLTLDIAAGDNQCIYA